MGEVGRRGFLTALLASPLIAKLDLTRLIEPNTTLADFAAKVARARDGDIFLVSQSLFDQLWKAMGVDNRYGSEAVAQAGFDHLLFHGKPVIWYPDGERDWLVQDLAHHLAKDGRLGITEIRV